MIREYPFDAGDDFDFYRMPRCAILVDPWAVADATDALAARPAAVAEWLTASADDLPAVVTYPTGDIDIADADAGRCMAVILSGCGGPASVLLAATRLGELFARDNADRINEAARAA